MTDNINLMESVDQYILQHTPEVQDLLRSIRKVIQETAPEASEKMSWQMPTYVLHGNLVHFAAHKKHIGFYPGPSGIEGFKHKFGEYKFSKGAVQFPIGKPMPYDLIREIVRLRVQENTSEHNNKQMKNPK